LPNISALKVQYSTARLPASMMQAGLCSVICSSADGQCVFIAFDLLYLNGKTCGRCRSSREKQH
jgi:ATP-dependent DNA ligase